MDGDIAPIKEICDLADKSVASLFFMRACVCVCVTVFCSCVFIVAIVSLICVSFGCVHVVPLSCVTPRHCSVCILLLPLCLPADVCVLSVFVSASTPVCSIAHSPPLPPCSLSCVCARAMRALPLRILTPSIFIVRVHKNAWGSQVLRADVHRRSSCVRPLRAQGRWRRAARRCAPCLCSRFLIFLGVFPSLFFFFFFCFLILVVPCLSVCFGSAVP